ncbi:MAG: metal ABC transporter substrate-binding protein [Solirubrobacteraceae bacterium]
MLPRWFIAALATTLAATILAACGEGDGGSGGGTGGPSVIATTTQVGDLARAVAGERASVTRILKPNSDPHEYEPRPSDVEAVTDAAVVLRSGGDLDEWLGGVLENAGNDTQVVTLIDAMRTRRLPGEIDPHWWQNPRNGAIAVEKIRDALIAEDAGGRAVYTANASAYLKRLRALDRAIEACIDAVPERDRKLVTDHDALGYYADRYGIDVVGTVIPALSTQAQASAGEVARLARTVRREKVKAVFAESSVNRKLAEAIARDSGATVGPDLYADTLGPMGSAGATYLGSLKANTQALVAGFTGGEKGCRL